MILHDQDLAVRYLPCRSRRAAVAVLLLLVLSRAVLAQTGPDNDPAGLAGFTTEPFATPDPDFVNLFNGQLTVPVAVGPSYPVGPNLRFQIVLTYNSRVWELGHPSTQSSSYTYTPITGNPALGIGWNFSLGAIKVCSATSSTHCYVGPDGGQHVFDEADAKRGAGFYKTSDGSRLSLKVNGTPDSCSDPCTGSSFEMWDEAGNHYVFDADNTPPKTGGHVHGYDDPTSNFTHDFGRGRDGWYLTKLEDPFHNNYTVTYFANSSGDSNSPCWTYQGTPLSTGAMKCPSYTAAPLTWIPSRITVPKGSGATQDVAVDLDPTTNMIVDFRFPVSGGGTATWTIGYPASTQCYINASSGTLNLRTLAAINFPSGIGGSPSYAFTYYRDNPTDGNPCGTSTCADSGLLKVMTLPTLGTISYRYRNYNFYHTRTVRFGPGCQVVLAPAGQDVAGSELIDCSSQNPAVPSNSDSSGASTSSPLLPIGGNCDISNPDAYLDTITLGVGQRTLTVGGVAATRDYFQYSFPYGEYGSGPSPNNCDFIGRCGSQSMTIVVYPEVDLNGGSAGTGHRTSRAYLFSVDSTGTAGGSEGAPLEDRIFDKDVSVAERPATPYTQPLCGPSAAPEQPFCSDKAVRITRRLFAYGDEVSSAGKRRVLNEATFYAATTNQQQCPSCAYHQVVFSNSTGRTWDASDGTGNGRHYNIETHSGNLGNDARAITTTWSPQVNGSAYLPDLFTERKDVLGSSTKDQFFEFDTATGFPTGTFIWDAANKPAWLNCKYKDGAGNVQKEFTKTFTAAAPPVNYCSTNFGTMPSVGTDQDMFGQSYAYQNGEILSAAWLNGTASIGWNRFSLTRDASTGWVTDAADSATASTHYVYDPIGRRTTVTPPGETSVSVSYPSMTQTIAQRNGGTGLTTSEELDYDGAGRLIRDLRLMPRGAHSKRFFLYDGQGTPYFASEWVSDATSETVNSTSDPSTTCSFSGAGFSTKRPAAAPGTYRLCFDPFGRPQQVVGTKFSTLVTVDRTSGSSYYSDVRQAATVACVNGAQNTDGSCGAGGSSALTKTSLDAYGRVTGVVEPSNDPTTYAYDVSDNLTTVTQTAQSRTFTYNPFGFLLTESTPEKGSVSYDTYGSLGNLRQMTESGVLITLRCYDAAGRVGSVRSNENGQTPACGSPGAGRLYLAFSYDQSSSPPSNYSLGKMTQRQDFNPSISQVPTSTEVLTYGGVGGRISQQSTTVTGSPALSVVQSWLYNTLGLPAVHSYPRPPGSLPFVVSTTYDAGLPAIEYVNGIPMITGNSPSTGVKYDTHGALSEYWTGIGIGTNTVTDISYDATGPLRPTEISARPQLTFTNIFDTGAYAYDGAGNIKAMGADAFAYDNRSRITDGYLAGVSGSNCQHFAYDLYGNLVSRSFGNWGGAAPCPQTTTMTYCTTGTCTNNQVTGATYTRGNLQVFGGETIGYDGLNRIISDSSGSYNYAYLGIDRVARIQSGNWTYTFRDEASRVATEYSGATVSRDNVFLGNLLVASYANGSVGSNGPVWTFYTSDHLGSPRLITDLGGNVAETRRYWPYGDDATMPQPYQRLRFATMERDTEASRYYDHVRSHDFNLGRFLSPDPVAGDPRWPQSWNRYGYVRANPIRLIDPWGLTTCQLDAQGQLHCEETASAGGDGTLYLPPILWDFYFSGNGVSGSTSGGGSGTFGPLPQGMSQKPYLQCVQDSADYFSLQQIANRATGGSVGNGFLSEAFLGSSVSSAITALRWLGSGVGGAEAARSLAGEAVSDATEKTLDALAPRVPNLSFSVSASVSLTVESPTWSLGLSAGGRLGGSLPLGTAVETGSSLLGALGGFKLPYDIAVGAFSAVICGIGR